MATLRPILGEAALLRHVLVTGGAGFIGSHMVLALLEQGARVTVADNLSIGHAAAVPAEARLVRIDLRDEDAVRACVEEHSWDAVFHFAALSQVGESMRDPFGYFRQNVVGGMNLIAACVRAGVRRFVLSSTASLFGTPERMPIADDAPVQPSSPYGESKAMLEQMLGWADAVHGLRSARLRYFNAAGADPAGRAGEDHRPETHLVPLAIDAAFGRGGPLSVFGDDYETPDGTCIRDYVHVSDLVEAHLRVLPLLEHASVSLNVGVGHGYSVREVIESVGRVAGRVVPHSVAPRRPGDPAMLVADATMLRQLTGWTPRFTALDEIVRTACVWREAHPFGWGGGREGRSGVSPPNPRLGAAPPDPHTREDAPRPVVHPPVYAGLGALPPAGVQGWNPWPSSRRAPSIQLCRAPRLRHDRAGPCGSEVRR